MPCNLDLRDWTDHQSIVTDFRWILSFFGHPYSVCSQSAISFRCWSSCQLEQLISKDGEHPEHQMHFHLLCATNHDVACPELFRLLNRSATVRSLYLAASWGAMGIMSLPREFLSMIVLFFTFYGQQCSHQPWYSLSKLHWRLLWQGVFFLKTLYHGLAREALLYAMLKP